MVSLAFPRVRSWTFLTLTQPAMPACLLYSCSIATMSQRFMRARVFAQGATVAALAVGAVMGLTGGAEKRDHEEDE